MRRCTLASQDCNDIRTELIASFSGIVVPDVRTGAGVLRTNTHPDIYAAVQKLKQLLGEDAKQLRLVVERVGYTRLMRMAPELTPLLDVYQYIGVYDFSATDIMAIDIAECVRDCLFVVALYDEQLFMDLTIAVLAVLAHDHIERELSVSEYTAPRQHMQHVSVSQDAQRLPFRASQPHFSREQFGRRLSSILQHHTNPIMYQMHVPPAQKVTDLDPVFVTIREGGAEFPMRLSLQIYLHDALRHHYSLVFQHSLIPAQEQKVQGIVSFPWERIVERGLSLQLRAYHRAVPSHRVAYHLTPETLATIRSKGSAASTLIGARHDIRLHPEYLYPGVDTLFLPENPLASIRVNHAIVELRKLHPDTDLTVFA